MCVVQSKVPCGNATSPLQKEGMESFDFSHEGAQDKNDWRLRIKGAS